jgi:hypothetical protein
MLVFTRLIGCCSPGALNFGRCALKMTNNEAAGYLIAIKIGLPKLRIEDN